MISDEAERQLCPTQSRMSLGGIEVLAMAGFSLATQKNWMTLVA